MNGRKGRNGKCGVTAEMRFLAKIQKTDSCWIWKASFVNSGYGQFWYNGKKITAHKFAYTFYKGPVPDEIDVCHTCDNKKCANPDHLFLGTTVENLTDMKRKGRSAKGINNGVYKHPEIIRRGENHGGSKTNNGQVIEIRNFYDTGIIHNICELARKFNLGQTTIRHIVKRDTWKTV